MMPEVFLCDRRNDSLQFHWRLIATFAHFFAYHDLTGNYGCPIYNLPVASMAFGAFMMGHVRSRHLALTVELISFVVFPFICYFQVTFLSCLLIFRTRRP